MKRLLALALFCGAVSASATDAPRPSFPDDYTPTKCPTVSCTSFDESQMPSAAGRFLGLTMNVRWTHEHLPVLVPQFDRLCAKLTSCFATSPNTKLFCMDIVAPEFRAICDRDYPKDKSPVDWDACSVTVETYLLGLDQQMKSRFEATRKCAEQTDPPRANKTLDVWMVPSEIKQPATLVPVKFYAIDHDTHVPVFAHITIEGPRLFAPSNPEGVPATGYGFKWPVKFMRVANAEGLQQSVAPMVTLNAAGYPAVSFRMPVEVPQIEVTASPEIASLRPGRKHRVTIAVRDATTGKEVDGRVMAGDDAVGNANQPFELDLRRMSKRPVIRLQNLSNSASDVTVK